MIGQSTVKYQYFFLSRHQGLHCDLTVQVNTAFKGWSAGGTPSQICQTHQQLHRVDIAPHKLFSFLSPP